MAFTGGNNCSAPHLVWGVAGRCQCCGVGGHPAQDAIWHPASIGSLLGARAALDVFLLFFRKNSLSISHQILYRCSSLEIYCKHDNNTVKSYLI